MAISTRRCLPYGSSFTGTSASSGDAQTFEQRIACSSTARRAPSGRSMSPPMPSCSATARQTFSSTDSPRNSVLIWNVRPSPRRTRAACGSAVISSTAEQDAASRWRQPPGDQVDERGLARAVGADQRMARAGLEPEVDVVRHDQCTEALVQADGFQRRRHRRSSRSIRPSTPPRANITSSTSSRPIQKYQNTGSSFANWSCAIM